MGFSVQDLRSLPVSVAKVLLDDLASERKQRALKLRTLIRNAKPMSVFDYSSLLKD